VVGPATQVRRDLLDLAKKYRGQESFASHQQTNYQRLAASMPEGRPE
jgi:hypothetical protein